MDNADHAKRFERFHRALSLAAFARNPQAEKPLIIGDCVCCLDCGEPINPERLQARPESVRCAPCKTIYERQHPYVPPFANSKGLHRERN